MRLLKVFISFLNHESKSVAVERSATRFWKLIAGIRSGSEKVLQFIPPDL